MTSIKPPSLFLTLASSALLLMLLSGCEAARQKASETPVGSLTTGETRDLDGYLERVEDGNRKAAETYEKYAEPNSDFISTPGERMRQTYDR